MSRQRRVRLAVIAVLVGAFLFAWDVRLALADGDCLSEFQQAWCANYNELDFQWWWGGCMRSPCRPGA